MAHGRGRQPTAPSAAVVGVDNEHCCHFDVSVGVFGEQGQGKKTWNVRAMRVLGARGQAWP